MATKRSRKAAEDVTSKKSKLDEVIDDADEVLEETEAPKAKSRAKPVKKKAAKDEEDVVELDGSDSEAPKAKPKAKAGRKKAKAEDEYEELDASASEEDDEPKPKKKVVKTRKGTTMEVEGDIPRTKKEAAAAKKAAASAGEAIIIAGPSESEPTREMPLDDPVVQKYNKMTISQLKDWLRANETVMTGKKEDLVARCVDGEINGRIPRCERCQLGKLHFNPDQGVYTCSGFFDDDSKMMIRCSFQTSTIKRLPWLNPEEAQAAKAQAEEAPKKSADKAVSNKVTDELVEKLRALSMKDCAEALVKFCREELHLSLPADAAKARMEVGPKMMTSRDEQGKVKIRDVISQLIVAFPPKEQPAGSTGGDAGAAAKKPGAPEAKVPENESIAALLDELAKYEKKKGGENVQFKLAALKKAAIAVRSLSDEITEGLPLGKPGKKKVEGIGKGTASVIQEFLDSGKTTSPYLENLKREVGEI